MSIQYIYKYIDMCFCLSSEAVGGCGCCRRTFANHDKKRNNHHDRNHDPYYIHGCHPFWWNIRY